MGLGSRTATTHSTRMSSVHEAVMSEAYADYSVGQRVITREGFIGKVEQVYDGPFPGTESYQITLEGGMGAGEYATRDIVGTAGHTQASFDMTGTAGEYYPELRDILTDRPDIAREP